MNGLELSFEMNGDGRLSASDVRREKLLVREDGSLVRGDVECGRLGITGFEDESRLRKCGDNLVRNEGSSATGIPGGARVEQGTLERSRVNPVLELVEMIKAFRVLETNLEMVRLQDAALDLKVNENVSARASRGTLGPRPFECPGARKGALT